LNVFDVIDWSHIGNSRDFIQVFLDIAFGNDVPQELPSGDSKCAFFLVQLDVESPEVVEVSSKSEMRQQLFFDFITISSM
jgi:hypothetical protein